MYNGMLIFKAEMRSVAMQNMSSFPGVYIFYLPGSLSLERCHQCLGDTVHSVSAPEISQEKAIGGKSVACRLMHFRPWTVSVQGSRLPVQWLLSHVYTGRDCQIPV